jgi:hypothetical protein
VSKNCLVLNCEDYINLHLSVYDNTVFAVLLNEAMNKLDSRELYGHIIIKFNSFMQIVPAKHQFSVKVPPSPEH